MKFVMMSTEAWQTGRSYTVGYYVSYPAGGQKYKCLQAHTSQPTWQPPNAPSLWQVNNTAYIDTVKASNVFDISSRGTKGFRCTDWYNRSFCDMQDDTGGQSKVLFFEGIACWISNYLEPENLGLLYGMGHAGLTMIGNSWPNSTDNDYTLYNDSLSSTTHQHNFGQAYLDYANRDFGIDNGDNFILFGAGTLKARSY